MHKLSQELSYNLPLEIRGRQSSELNNENGADVGQIREIREYKTGRTAGIKAGKHETSRCIKEMADN